MAAFLAGIQEFFNSSTGMMADILDTVIASPALTVLVLGFPIVGFAFGLLRRLISM